MTDKELALKVFTEARRLIKEVGWCQGYMAVDATGMPTGELTENAVAFCAGGALTRAASGFPAPESEFAHHWPCVNCLEEAVGVTGVELLAGRPARGAECISVLNDKEWTTQEDAIEAFDRAIERLSAEVRK